ncbi:Integrase/recombinase family protein [Tenacibaculum maritimum]|uniref:hypothetical protein n=1 Tax=Tenacibaculum maritimum TaxID=107401 RepID=UPI0012E43D02|nr:hypothetical protein [Tenacibaculum maritimum]CAA0229171.1 Integrase/recombinase family protein [Tenacibaculum maritimum]
MKTPIIRYYLESKSKDVEERVVLESIMVEVNYGYKLIGSNRKGRNKPFRLALKAMILPKDFGKKENNFIYDEAVFKKYSRKNNTIKVKMGFLEKAIHELENHYVVNRIMPKPEEFKKELIIKLYGEQDGEIIEQTILDFVYNKIKDDERNLKIEQKKGISKGTIKSYKTLSHHLENYEIATGDILKFSTFDEVKYWSFWDVLNDIFKGKVSVKNPNQPIKQRTNVNGYSANSLQKHQKNLLRVLRLAKKEHKLVLDLEDESLTLKNSESMKDFYVSELELQKIIDTDVSHDVKLQRAKEYSIVAGLTGMRFESMFDIVNETIEVCEEDGFNFKYVHSKQNKTKTEVYIPLLKPIQDILEKYDGRFPKFPINQTINEDLKELFEYLEIDEIVIITKVTYSEGTVVNRVPKYKMISAHDFKHSFYSNLYKYKVRQSVIDDITHPDRVPKNAMAKVYNRANMLDKAKMFVTEIMKIDSHIYKF